ncbi:sensor histidine kinase [Streptomyces sp. NPDC002004]
MSRSPGSWPSRMVRPLTRAVTYTRWAHLLVGSVFVFVCGTAYPGLYGLTPADWALMALWPAPLVAAAALVPGVRLAEGHQALLMLFPGRHARGDADGPGPGIHPAPSESRGDRGRTAVWMVLRLEAGFAAAVVTAQLVELDMALVSTAAGAPIGGVTYWSWLPASRWAAALLAPAPLLVLAIVAVASGALMAAASRRLLGPSPAQRLAALEERTERLLERNRIARELHDSIGHALTVAVVQAGAARAAADPGFTDRALDAIEETGRAALEDLERVLLVLREADQPPSSRPTLADADRLLASARASGAEVDAEVTGPVDTVPGPVSREGYRMLQEALTNVLRHAGTVPVSVRIGVDAERLRLTVRNALPAGSPVIGGGTGSGLRGVRERAALLGGRAHTGPDRDEWQVHVELPVR